MIDMVGISKIYRTDCIETHAISNITLNVMRGEFISIMGPSGSGKSTLLNILGLMDTASSGSFTIDGHDVRTASDVTLTRLRRIHSGFIFQGFNLLPHLNVVQNVELGLVYRGVARADRTPRCMEALNRVGLDARATHYPGQLSGGQQQRAAIARAIVGKPSLILADEPTGNLDSVNGDAIMDILVDLAGEGTTIVMVTHDEMLGARASRTIRMRDGKLL